MELKIHAYVYVPHIISIPQTTTMTQNDSPLRLLRISFHNHGQARWHHALFLVLLLTQTPPPAASQLQESPMEPPNNKSMVAIMGIIAFMFLVSGFLSLYSRQCSGRRARVRARLDLAIATGNPSRQSQNDSLGLSQETINTFPTFLYSSVKGLKIGTCALACAVCLSEFQDEETLRLIPKCSHVFHPSCIDVWLASHSTCPVCRADLVPRENDVVFPMLSTQIPDDINQVEQRPNDEEENVIVVVGGSGGDSQNDVESSRDELLRRSRTVNHIIGPTRSRSTGFLCAVLFPRSNSTGHSVMMVQPGDEDFERFTLRLPDDVRSQVLNSTLKRAKSCVGFARMSSGTKGYRTRSVGGGGRGGGRSYFQCERFGGDHEQWGFTLTPPFFTRSCNRLGRKSLVQCSGVALDNNVGERSSHLLCPG